MYEDLLVEVRVYLIENQECLAIDYTSECPQRMKIELLQSRSNNSLSLLYVMDLIL